MKTLRRRELVRVVEEGQRGRALGCGWMIGPPRHVAGRLERRRKGLPEVGGKEYVGNYKGGRWGREKVHEGSV